jgi:hypothetical protein
LDVDSLVDTTLDPFLEFLRRSSSVALGQLTFHEWDEGDLAEDVCSSLAFILEHCQHLTKLNFRGGSLDATFLASLVIEDDEGEWMCPKLKELSLVEVCCSMELVAEVIRSRDKRSGVKALSSVHVNKCTPLNEELDMSYAVCEGLRRSVEEAVAGG